MIVGCSIYIYIYIFFSLRILHALLRFCRPLLIEMISSRKPMFHVYRKGRTRHPGRYASRTMECGVHGTRFDYRPACNCNQKLWRCGGVYFHSPTELHETIRGPSDRSRFKLPGQHVFGSFENWEIIVIDHRSSMISSIIFYPVDRISISRIPKFLKHRL